MAPERRAWKVFEQCLQCEPEQWNNLLTKLCAGDPALQQEVASLLSASRHTEGFLESEGATAEGDLGAANKDLENLHVGRYKLLRLLKHGGMGTVYLASGDYDGFEKRVALKLLQPDLQERGEILRRFRTERRILASLDHPNIARFLDSGATDKGQPYFVMEYVEGLSIDEYCDAHKLSITERLKLFCTVCSGVQVAHQNTLVHRDLKPDNILVTANGEPKLLDFGIVKLLNPELVAPSFVRTMLCPLTPEYASPEQVKDQPITTASDVYSLGVLLYQLLTGHRPYDLANSERSELEKIICEYQPENPSTVVTRHNKGVSGDAGTTVTLTPEAVSKTRGGDPHQLQRQLAGDLDSIVLKALHKEPWRRYASAEQFAEDIRRHLKNLPVVARSDTFVYRASKFFLRHRLGVTAGAAALVAALVFGLVMADQRAQVTQALERAERATAFLTELFEASDPFFSTRELLDFGAEKLDRLEDQPETRADLQNTVGVIYRRIGLLDRATPLLKSALATRLEQFGDRHPKVAESQDDLGMLLLDRGQIADAEKLLCDALATRRELFSGDHPEIAGSLNNVGILRQKSGDYPKAEAHLFEAVEMRRRLDEPQKLAKSLSDLAGVLKDRGEDARAEKLLRESLDIFRRYDGNDHLHTATALSNLASFIRDRGDLEQAETLFREARDVFKRRLGDEHGYVAQSLHNLAGVVLRQGKTHEAETLLNQSLAISRKVLGNEHNMVAQSLGKLASVLLTKGEPQAAEPIAREAIEILRLRLADSDWRIAAVQSKLGQALYQQRRFAEAESVLIAAYRALRAQRKPEDHHVLRVRELLCELYRDWQKPHRIAEYCTAD